MGKKKRARSAKTSKGERRSISKSTVQLVRRSKPAVDKFMDKLIAWKKGKNPWITIDGHTPSRARIKVKANSLYGDPRRRNNPNTFGD